MKKHVLLFTLTLTLLLCACAPASTETTAAPETTLLPETTLPPETTQPPETTIPETSEPEAAEPFADWYDMLEYTYPERNWIRSAMSCVFERPEEIDLEYLFYNGLSYGGWDKVSPESEQYLIEQGFWREMDLQPMPVSELNRILDAVFDISLSDMTIPDAWVYLETEDFYCSNHNDAYGFVDYTITEVTELDDGLVKISYTVDSYFYNPKTDEFYDFADLVLILRQTKDGNLQVVSNVLVPRNVG